MYEDIHEAAKHSTTTLNAVELLAIANGSLVKRKAIIKDWQRIDQLIFKTSNNKGQNQ